MSPSGQDTAIVAGIDEAGYGPLLGPLVVSAVAFEVPAALLEPVPPEGPDFWTLWRDAVTARTTARDPRLAVADSKKLYKRASDGRDLRLLERAALVFLALAGEHPGTLRSLLRRTCPPVPAQLDEYPWYRGADIDLPTDCTCGDLAVQAAALRRASEASGVRFRGVFCEVLPEGHYNRLAAAVRNKSVLLFMQVGRLLQRIAADLPGRPLHVFVDRQGGRVSYLRPLMRTFDDAAVQVIEETPRVSVYRLEWPDRRWRIGFRVSGEEHQLAVALASIFSKYTRELLMACFNRYWCGLVPGLRPTAGYHQDGQRFLEALESTLRRTGIDRAMLVRTL